MINIYIDTSGSMLEMGKDSALLYLAKSIEDYCSFKDINTNFFTLDTQVIKDLTSIKFSNDIKLDTNNIKSNSILLSDGLFNSEEESIFDISFSIGIDSDTSNLKKISTKVFSSDNILAGLEYLIFTNNLLNSNITQEEDDDEW
ncbi:hypothetical protein [Aliarcobacter cryaerophilus]|uniref:hypothetical protein n=1 Tax=Aliarcobacter cryaerophilus TaxID=28198 RepID=UPI0021B5A231|nr:hypothetical protein [Aliarcobacter cryaerophilus]MCT7518913.1 hypothetical protein [Aliarcobacter cryaerophilus]